MKNLFLELKRRNVFRVAGMYTVIAWLLAQIASVLESALKMPAWFDTMVVSCLLLGFPIAVILAWAFELTPEGVKRTEAASDDDTASQGRRTMDYVLVGALAVVGLLIVGDRLGIGLPGEKSVASSIGKSGSIEGQSIAVLPFEDFSPKKDQAYFADGIAEELLNVLARVDGLRVASRTSSFSYQDRKASVAEIGEALNVAYILEGSVRKAGDTLRITAQLIDTKTDKHVWSETYDRPLTAENIFQIQDEISKAIVLELNGRIDLLPDANKPLTKSTKALEAYLKGKAAYATRDADDIETGITELIRAVTLDPEFAVAHAKLARAYRLATEYGELASVNANPRAQIHIEKALALAPDDSEVLSDYAWWLNSSEASTDKIVAAFDAAIAANPNNAEAYRGKGFVLLNNGRFDKAKIALERAKALNPRDSLIYANLAQLAAGQDDFETAKNLSIKAVQLNPDSLYFRGMLGDAYNNLGEIETAHRVYQSCLAEKLCARNLYPLYLQLGMQTDGLRPLSDYEYLIKNYVAGDFDQIAQQLSVNTEYSATYKVELYALIGRWDEAYTLIQNNPSVFEPYLSGKPSNSDADIYTQIALLATLERKRDPRATAVRASLSNKYKNMVPGKRAGSSSYLNGAAWAMLNDDPDRAMVWLNAMADRGIYTLLGHDALLEPLKPRADYQAFLARMDGFKTRDRALLEAQLANPPKVWWSPSELAEAKTP